MSALVQTAASVKPSAGAIRARPAPAGIAIAAGQPIYYDPAVNQWNLADADVAAAAADVQAVAGNTAGVGQMVDPILEDSSFTHGLTGVAAGDTIWNYTTAGTYTKTVGDLITGVFTSVVMVAQSATVASLKIVRSGTTHA